VKRTAIARRTPLRANKNLQRSRFMTSHRKSKYARRERDFEFMSWVRTRPCMVSVLSPFLFIGSAASAAKYKLTPCQGPIESDHMGMRGMGQKADDSTCVPMCRGHHSERHAHAGTFYPLVKAELRAWRAEAIKRTQIAWAGR
jgi:hypothetical protein